MLTFEFVASCRGEKILGVACLSNLQIEPYGTPRQFSLEKKKEELKKKKKKKKRSTYQFLILYSNEKNCLTSADTVCLYYLSKESPQTLPDKCAGKQSQRDRTCNRADNFFCLEYNNELLHEAFGVQNKHK